MKWMWQQPENVANHNSAWGYETEQHYSCPVWWGIKYWLDPSESTRYKGENELSLFQAVLPFVAVGSLTCLGSIFLAVKMSADDWELLTPQHDSTLLDLSVSISHSSAPPQKPCFLTCFFFPFYKWAGTAIPLLGAPHHNGCLSGFSLWGLEGFGREGKLLLIFKLPW